MILLMVQKSCTSWYGKYSVIYWVLAPSKRWLGIGFLNPRLCTPQVPRQDTHSSSCSAIGRSKRSQMGRKCGMKCIFGQGRCWPLATNSCQNHDISRFEKQNQFNFWRFCWRHFWTWKKTTRVLSDLFKYIIGFCLYHYIPFLVKVNDVIRSPLPLRKFFRTFRSIMKLDQQKPIPPKKTR